MNIITIILAIIILSSTISGYTRGFILSLSSLLSWIGSLLLMFFLYPYIGDLLKTIIQNSLWIIPIAILLSLVLTTIIVSLIVNQILEFIPVEAHFNPINKIIGILPGAVNGLLYATLLSWILLMMPLSDWISNETRESKIAQELTLNLERIEDRLKPEFKEAISRTMQRTIIEEGPDEMITLPFAVIETSAKPALEQEMLAMVNKEREKHGLRALEADTQLREVAREHSRDMFARSYFSHVSPDGHTPYDRAVKFNVRFMTIGENLALAQTLPIAHDGLMKSPGHRANILQPAFRKVGIGIIDGGVYGLMITQNFKN